MPTTEDLNRTIARWLDAHGYPELAWEPDGECPQGHDAMFYLLRSGTINPEKWIPTGLCLACIAKADTTLEDIRQHYKDPDWHPEWRIQAVPNDFSQPAPLLAAVEAWRKDREYRRWEMHSRTEFTETYAEADAVVVNEYHRDFYKAGETPELALRAALAAAIVAENEATP